MKQETKNEIEIKTATHLALVEILAGSVGHGFKIPFTGTMLSYYQLYVSLLMIKQRKVAPISVFNVAVIVALLKTLSPMGKKITPMIAITVQGFLLWLGTAIFGTSTIGLALGAAFMVIWSVVQSALGYVLLYGFDFFRMIDFFQNEITKYVPLNVYGVFFTYLVLKIVLAWALLAFVLVKQDKSSKWILPEEKIQRLRQRLDANDSTSFSGSGSGSLPRSSAYRALKDLLNPFFLGSLLLMISFHLFRESSSSTIIWFICRTLGVGFLLLYLIRSRRFLRWMLRSFSQIRGFRRLMAKTRRVGRRITESSHTSN